jgi:hypothetical protein
MKELCNDGILHFFQTSDFSQETKGPNILIIGRSLGSFTLGRHGTWNSVLSSELGLILIL